MLTEPMEVFLQNICYICPTVAKVDGVRHLSSKVSGINQVFHQICNLSN